MLLLRCRVLFVTFSPHDSFFLLDAAWRIFNGHVPNLDYHDIIGPLAYAITAAGMRIFGPVSYAIVYGSWLFFVLSIVIFWLIAATRIPPAPAVALALTGSIGIVGKFAIGWPGLSYAMIYNRYGYALLSGILIYAFLRPQRRRLFSSPILWQFADVAAGALLAAALLLKLNFFMVAAAAIALHLGVLVVTRYRVWAVSARLTAGFVGFLVFCYFWFGFSPGRFVADMAALVEIGRNEQRNLVHDLRRLVSFSNPWIWAVLVISTLAIALPNRQGWGSSRGDILPLIKRMRRILAIGAFAVGADAFLTNTNTQNGMLWLFPLTISLVALQLLDIDFTSRRAAVVALASCLVAMAMAGFALWREAPRLWIAAQHSESPPPDRRIQSPHLGDMYLPRDMIRDGEVSFPERINTGLELLRYNGSQSDRVMVLDFANPFSFALGLQPPRGATLCLAHRCFGTKLPVAPSEAFKNATLLMIPSPREAVSSCCNRLVEEYGTYIREHFRIVGEDAHWTLLRQHS